MEIWVVYKESTSYTSIGGKVMKKICVILCSLLLVLLSMSCTGESSHKLSYVGFEKAKMFDQYECIAVYTQYTNESGETAVPADWVSVKAFQNGVELTILVPTGEKTNGYVQCDTSVQNGTTADVVWIFQLDDESDVSLEITGNDTICVSLSEE